MKCKMWILALTACLMALPFAVRANEAEPVPWDFFQMGIWNGIGPDQNVAMVCGFRAGLPVCGGTAAVNGAEIALLGASSDTVNGFQWGVIGAISEKIRGCALGLFTWSSEVDGVQIGVVNVAKTRSFQIGLINVIQDSPLVCFPFVNVKF